MKITPEETSSACSCSSTANGRVSCMPWRRTMTTAWGSAPVCHSSAEDDEHPCGAALGTGGVPDLSLAHRGQATSARAAARVRARRPAARACPRRGRGTHHRRCRVPYTLRRPGQVARPCRRAVVVFIDDLDRCLPETVVDTFEAIRLLLGAPRTAFVVAANQKIVESAVDARYPELRDDDRARGIGAQYLEKMLQPKITVPALAVPEAVTYINLLLAELHLGKEDFTRVREHVAGQRATHSLEVAFNLGILGDLKAAVPAELVGVGRTVPAARGVGA